MSRALGCITVALVLASAACCQAPTYEVAPAPAWSAPPRNTAPNSQPQVDVPVPAFPPLGPLHPLVVSASDAGGDLRQVDVQFRQSRSFAVSGAAASVSVPLAELGEGRGTLHVRVHDRAGAFSDWSRAGTVVDLRAPVVVPPSDATVRAGQQVALWIADDWALGSYEARHDDWVVQKTFPALWPATAGKDWDETLVLTPALSSDGWHQISVKASDAAGNVVETVVFVDVDAHAPTATVLLPLPGDQLTGASKLLLSAADDRDTPVTLEVFLGGVPIATTLGPSAAVDVDVEGFVKGPTELVVVPMDGAGNTGEPARVPVVIH